MKKALYYLIILFIWSCSKDECIDSDQNDNIIELKYYEEYWDQRFSKTFTIIDIRPFVKKVSLTEEVHLLQVTARTNYDNSNILFKVFADSIGNNVLYNNVFDFRTGIGLGCPYNAVTVEMQVLANNNKEFTANFTGSLRHYNQWVPEYIYLDISYGSIRFRY